jgi:hypothetical protein
MHRYKDLSVWQKAMDLVVEIYKITENSLRMSGLAWSHK